jgi:hypothetical protein
MTVYVTAARIAAVVTLFALPPLLVPDDAAAADRRYGTKQSTQSSRQAPQPVYVPPQPRPNTKEFVRQVCRSYKAMGRPLEYKECMDSQR